MKGHEINLRNINTKDIVVDKNGQRDVELRKQEFNRIMKNYNPDLMDPISVAYVDGKYYCYDGQMRMKVAKAENGGKDTTMRAMVIDGLTLPEVADLFLKRNDPTTHVDVKLSDKIRVSANYGSKDELNFIRILERNNFRIDKWNASIDGGVLIQATKAIWDEYHNFETSEDFDTFLYILYNAYATKKLGVSGKIIKGLGLLTRIYKGDFKAQDMATSLRKKSPIDIIADAEGGRRKHRTVDYTEQMVNQYNLRRRNYKLDESKLMGAK